MGLTETSDAEFKETAAVSFRSLYTNMTEVTEAGLLVRPMRIGVPKSKRDGQMHADHAASPQKPQRATTSTSPSTPFTTLKPRS